MREPSAIVGGLSRGGPRLRRARAARHWSASGPFPHRGPVRVRLPTDSTLTSLDTSLPEFVVRTSVALSFTLALTLTMVGARPAQAQPAAAAAALKKAFEGREVMVLMDMPATHRGVDLYLQQEPEIRFSDYAQRTKDFGIALRKEDRVMITMVKVNKKNIEIHLGGGGYGTFSDDSGYVAPSFVGKSRREQDLEKERKRTNEAWRIREIDRELNYLRREREREEREARREAEALTAIKQREVAAKRLDGGSRFNIWYPDKRLEQWAPTPEELMYSLAAYLDFGEAGGPGGDGVPGVSRGTPGNRLTSTRSEGPRDVEGAAMSLRRGMSSDEVHDLLGRPTRRRSSKQGDLEAVIETWETTDSVTEVTLVGGVVVKFTSSSK